MFKTFVSLLYGHSSCIICVYNLFRNLWLSSGTTVNANRENKMQVHRGNYV